MRKILLALCAGLVVTMASVETVEAHGPRGVVVRSYPGARSSYYSGGYYRRPGVSYGTYYRAPVPVYRPPVVVPGFGPGRYYGAFPPGYGYGGVSAYRGYGYGYGPGVSLRFGF